MTVPRITRAFSLPGEHLAGGRRDLALGQDARSHLVEQRLEQVVGGAGDEGDVDVGPLQGLGAEQPPNPEPMTTTRVTRAPCFLLRRHTDPLLGKRKDGHPARVAVLADLVCSRLNNVNGVGMPGRPARARGATRVTHRSSAVWTARADAGPVEVVRTWPRREPTSWRWSGSVVVTVAVVGSTPRRRVRRRGRGPSPVVAVVVGRLAGVGQGRRGRSGLARSASGGGSGVVVGGGCGRGRVVAWWWSVASWSVSVAGPRRHAVWSVGLLGVVVVARGGGRGRGRRRR